MERGRDRNRTLTMSSLLYLARCSLFLLPRAACHVYQFGTDSEHIFPFEPPPPTVLRKRQMRSLFYSGQRCRILFIFPSPLFLLVSFHTSDYRYSLDRFCFLFAMIYHIVIFLFLFFFWFVPPAHRVPRPRRGRGRSGHISRGCLTGHTDHKVRDLDEPSVTKVCCVVIFEYCLVAIDSRGLQRPFRAAALFINRRRARLAQVWRLYPVRTLWDDASSRRRHASHTFLARTHHAPHRRPPPARGHHWGCRIKKQGGWRGRHWERGRELGALAHHGFPTGDRARHVSHLVSCPSPPPWILICSLLQLPAWAMCLRFPGDGRCGVPLRRRRKVP